MTSCQTVSMQILSTPWNKGQFKLIQTMKKTLTHTKQKGSFTLTNFGGFHSGLAFSTMFSYVVVRLEINSAGNVCVSRLWGLGFQLGQSMLLSSASLGLNLNLLALFHPMSHIKAHVYFYSTLWWLVCVIDSAIALDLGPPFKVPTV